MGYGGKAFLQPGQYSIEIEINSSQINLNGEFLSVIATWKENKFPHKHFVGGIRIKEIADYASGTDLNPSVLRKYQYVNNENLESGWIKGVPVYRYTAEACGEAGLPAEMVTSGNCNPQISNNQDYIGYMAVREIKVSGSEELVTENTFSGTTGGSYLGTQTTFGWEPGRPLRTRIYKKKAPGGIVINHLSETHHLLQEKSIVYHNARAYSSLYPISKGIDLHSSLSTGNLVYTLYTGPDLKTKKETVTDYFYHGSAVQEVVSVTETHYKGSQNTPLIRPNHVNPISIKKFQSPTDYTEEKIFYPLDLLTHPYFTASEISGLLAQQQLAIPLLQENWRNGVKMSTMTTTYTNWGNNMLLPQAIKTSKGDSSLASVSPLESKIIFSNVDNTTGNVQELYKNFGTKIAYIWGYDKTKVIAMIENGDFSGIAAQAANLQQLSDTGSEANLIIALDALRSSLPNSLVTTYTHKPLIGVSTITSPTGDRIAYYYDEFNRLQKITDREGNILSESEYHYRTQN